MWLIITLGIAAPPQRLDQAHDPAKLEAQLRECVEQHRVLLGELEAELELEKRDCEEYVWGSHV